MNIQVVDIPQGDQISWGKFSSFLDQVEALPEGKCISVGEKITMTHMESLRKAARLRGYSLHIRRTPDATYIWKKEAKQ